MKKTKKAARATKAISKPAKKPPRSKQNSVKELEQRMGDQLKFIDTLSNVCDKLMDEVETLRERVFKLEDRYASDHDEFEDATEELLDEDDTTSVDLPYYSSSTPNSESDGESEYADATEDEDVGNRRSSDPDVS